MSLGARRTDWDLYPDDADFVAKRTRVEHLYAIADGEVIPEAVRPRRSEVGEVSRCRGD